MGWTDMDRRGFILSAGAAGVGMAAGFSGAGLEAGAAELPRFSAGSSPDGPVLWGDAMVSGPSAESMTILQPLQRHATGYLEYAVGDGAFERVDAGEAGLLPFERYVLKFRLPALPGGVKVRYRVTARTIGWVPVGRFEYGKIVAGKAETGATRTFRTLDPAAETTRFVVWNDTHENEETLKALHGLTERAKPDFLLWNGDQTNDVHQESKMTGQFLRPFGLSIAREWPLAYVRGNHDVRGPAARRLACFTGTPEDRFYYAFRSGPVAGLVMDTGEDKADDHPNFAGLASFEALRARQAVWLGRVRKEAWFAEAPFKVLFCHLPLWWVRDRKDIDWWEYSKVSRDAWLGELLAAGVKVVISGHTHSARWMPAGAEQALGQLIGGGPAARHATIIQGDATRSALTLRMRKLDGTLLEEVTFGA